MAADDMDLVRQYAGHKSESAFGELVSRHANLVYSVALRRVRDAQLAEEITQAVFIVLARKSGSLHEKTILTGWLYRTTCYISNAADKKEHDRRAREQEAYMQSTLENDHPDASWDQVSPLLEEAMLRLGQTDRDALLLRFFENRSFNEVGMALGLNEDAAKKRVSRALEKLHRYFSKRGVCSTTSLIGGAISANSVQAAPVALAKSVTAIAFTKGAAASSSTLTLIKGGFKVMAWTKLKIAAVVCIAALVAAGTAAISIRTVSYYHEKAREAAVWVAVAHVIDVVTDPRQRLSPSDIEQVQSLSNVISIRHTQFASQIADGLLQNADAEMLLGIAMPASGLLGHAYGVRRTRVVNPEELPPGKYDFVVNLPDHRMEALQTAIKKDFGLTARRVMRGTNVLLLSVATTNVPALKPGTKRDTKAERYFGTGIPSDDRVKYRNRSVDDIALLLEHHMGIPVIDQTGMRGLYDFDMEPDNDGQTPDLQSVNQSLLDQLGLQLTPATRMIEMLEVKKEK